MTWGVAFFLARKVPTLDTSEANLKNFPCPWLPEITQHHDFNTTRQHGNGREAGYYLDTLRYAQSQWTAGKPAQAILQLNKSWSADLAEGDPVLTWLPPPYRALVWIVEKSADGSCGYLGNPVRHFQHLATRVSGARSEVRSARAWMCFHLTERVLKQRDFPRDGHQLFREGIRVPSLQQVYSWIERLGWVNEADECAILFSAPPAA